MIKLCFGSLAQLVKNTKKSPKNRETVELLLGIVLAIVDIKNQRGDIFCVNDKNASQFINCRANLPSSIVEAVNHPRVISEAVRYVDKDIRSELKPAMIPGLISDICDLIQGDASINDKLKSDLLSESNVENFPSFFSRVLLYTLQINNDYDGVVPCCPESVFSDDERNSSPIALTDKQILEKNTTTGRGDTFLQYRLVPRFPQVRDVFYGRDVLLADIHYAFEEGNRTIFLEGMGGIGKSELAKQYAVKYKQYYNTILFITYTGSLMRMVCDSDTIEITGLEHYPSETDDDFFRRKLSVLRALTNVTTLIIIDNFDVDVDANLSLFLEGTFRVLITSRNIHDGFRSFSVPPLSNIDDLFRVFRANYGLDIDDVDRESLKELFELVEYHTYTIELLAKQMNASFLSGPELLEMYKKGRLQSSPSETFVGNGRRETAFNHICTLLSTSNLSEEEKQVLRHLSLVGIEGIPATIYKDWSKIENYDIVNELIAKSWIRRNRKRISLHPLVIEVVHERLTPDSDNCGDFLDSAGRFSAGSWRRPVGNNIEVSESILCILKYFFPFNINCWASYESMIGFLWQVSKFDDAIKFGKALYECSLHNLGEASHVTGVIAKSLGACYFNSNHLKESVDFYKMGLHSILLSGDEYGEDLASSYEKVGRCYTWDFMLDIRLADQYLNKALSIRMKDRDKFLRGDNSGLSIHPYYDCSLKEIDSGIAGNYQELGRMKQVEGDYRKALNYALRYKDFYMSDPLYSPSHLAYGYYDEGVCYYHLGMNEQNQGDKNTAIDYLNRAESSLKNALSINLHMRGTIAFDTVDNQEYLGDTYVALGRIGEASNAYLEAIKMLEKLAGPDCEEIKQIKEKINTL